MITDYCSLCHQASFFCMTVQRKCKRAQSLACLSYAECSLSYYAVQRYRLSSDTTKFRVAISPDFQQALIQNLVNKTNSYFCGGRNIVFLDGKHSLSRKKIPLSCDFSRFLYPLQFSSKSYSSYSSYSSELTP